MGKMNLPNRLTSIRLLLVPVFIMIYLFDFRCFNIDVPVYDILGTSLSLIDILAAIIFVSAAITDYFDGKLARRKNLVTTFGKFIDPIADKLLVNSALILLTYFNRMSVIALLIMILRDTFVDGIRLACVSKNVVLPASIYGKAKTMTQMIGITLLILNNPVFHYFKIPFASIVIWIAAFISALSGVDYFVKNKGYIMESM